jgi:hypothetical protein
MQLWNCFIKGTLWFLEYWPYFVVCGFCRTIKICGYLILLFMRLFSCLCLSVWTWYELPIRGWCEMPIRRIMWTTHDGDDVDLFYPFSTCTLTHIKSLEYICWSRCVTDYTYAIYIGKSFLLWGRIGPACIDIAWHSHFCIPNKLESFNSTKLQS